MNPTEQTTRVRVVDVALDPRTGGAEAVWTYAADGRAQLGDAVTVPLGTRSAMGFVVREYQASAEDLGFPLTSLRKIHAVVDGLSIPPQSIDLVRFVAEEYLTTLPCALSAATPPGVRDRLTTRWIRLAAEAPKTLPPVQSEALRVIEEGGGIYDEPKNKLEAAFERALKRLATLGLIERRLRLGSSNERVKAEVLLKITSNEAKVNQFLLKEGRKKPAQALTLMRLQSADEGALTPAEIRALAGVTEATVKALVTAGLLESVRDAEHVTHRTPPVPNPAQQLSIDAVSDAVHARRAEKFLLFGVTGSGKTEVYMRAAAEALKAGRQVLYIVPEIALAAQAIAQLRERFGATVSVLHSELPANERLRNWLRIRNGESSVILGARSALFAPLTNLGLVIVDEEHEAAYKQESAPRYHAKRVAVELGRSHQCPVLLGSATPSVESFTEAESGELILLSLPQRAASAQLPEVRVRNLADGYRAGRPAILTDELIHLMRAALERGEQAILFLNRRAYAPFIMCRECGGHIDCPHCSVSLSWHRRDGRLKCHQCGYQTSPPERCPKCDSAKINPFGVGTEKVEESVVADFEGFRVARLDRDVARRAGVLEETLAGFRSGDISILVGTQMVAKGLDFPKVTVVGVIAADVSLNIPDFRASERTFQLLSQVAGRAGRGTAHGIVVIQTFNPEHPSVVFASQHDYLAFFDAIRVERELAGYPPYRRLVNIILSGEDRPAVNLASSEVERRIREHVLDCEILGPVDCPIERVMNRWRRHILLKLPPEASVQPIGVALLGYEPKGVQIVTDVDPHSLM